VNWTIRTSAADNYWRSVCYGNGLFVAVATTGTGNRVMTSPDGVNWTIRTSAAGNSWYSVCQGATAVPVSKFGRSVYLPDAYGYVNCGAITSLSNVNAYTQRFVINPVDGMTTKQYVSYQGADANNYLACRIEGGNLAIDFKTGGTLATGYISVSGNLSAGVWSDVVVVYDGTKSDNANRLKLYINGVQKTLSFTGTIPAVTPTLTGVNFYVGNTSESFAAYIDCMSLYNIAITDIQTQYNILFVPNSFFTIRDDVAKPRSKWAAFRTGLKAPYIGAWR
jgi:hypothetical protein